VVEAAGGNELAAASWQPATVEPAVEALAGWAVLVKAASAAATLVAEEASVAAAAAALAVAT
jgi:hypothetical protein